MEGDVVPESDEEIAEEIDAEYPSDDPITNKASISLETFVLLIVVGSLIAVTIGSLLTYQQPAPRQINNNSPIFVYVNGNLTELTPGTAAYNQAAYSINYSNTSGTQGDIALNTIATLLALFMFIGFFVSRRSVIRSDEKTWLVYVFIITSVFGWGALGTAMSLIIGGGFYGSVGGLGGAYYAFWKLQDKGFM
jgi:hypothetical protein